MGRLDRKHCAFNVPQAATCCAPSHTVGIFGYYSFNVSKDLQTVLDTLFSGLKRLEYRGYDSAGQLRNDSLHGSLCTDTFAMLVALWARRVRVPGAVCCMTGQGSSCTG